MKIVMTGGTGFIGAALLPKLVAAGHKIVLLTRHTGKLPWLNKNYVSDVNWDGKTLGDWAYEAEGADAMINLAGEPIARKRWTHEEKKKIVESRVNATRTLVWAIQKAAKKPSVLINASAVGYYGDVPDSEVTESSPKGSGFLSDTCEVWEKEALIAKSYGVRVVIVRIGVVLGPDGGALSKMIPPFNMFLGGSLGSGRQWFPWVHRDDVAGAILFALNQSGLSGPVNIAAPGSVTMKDFCSALGGVLNRPSWAPVPAFALKLMLGEMSEMLLTGQKAIPKKLLESGYQFRHPKLDEALAEIFK